MEKTKMEKYSDIKSGKIKIQCKMNNTMNNTTNQTNQISNPTKTLIWGLIGSLIFIWAISFVNAYNVVSTEIPPTSLIVNYGLSQIDEIEPGENGNAVIVIQNIGGLEAKDVEVFTHDTQYLSAEFHQKLGTINPGGSVSVVVPIKAKKDAKTGTTFIPLTLSYKSYSIDTMYRSKNVKDIDVDWSIPVKIKGTALFSLENFSIDKTPEPGKRFTMTIRFKNNKGEAKDTYILVNNNVNQQTMPVSTQSQSASSMSFSPSQQAHILALQGKSMPSLSSPSQQMMALQKSTPQSVAAPSSTQTFSVIGINKKFFGDIKKGEEISAKFEIYVDKNANSGVYNLPVKITYKNKETTKTDEFTIGIFVSGQENIIISDIITEPKKIYAKDKDVKLNLKIQNTGSREVDYLKIYPIYNDIFKNSESYLQVKDLGKLKAGDEKSADFYFDIGDAAKEKAYKLKFLINYKVGGIVKEKNISAIVEVQEKPNFEISYDLKPVTAGKNNIKLKVKNTGSDCDDVKIYPVKKTDLPFDWEESSEYIGDLKNNEEGEAVMKFSVKSNANNQIYLVPVEIRCVKNDDVFVQSEKIKIEVNGSGSTNKGYLIIIAVILIIVIAIFIKFKKTRK